MSRARRKPYFSFDKVVDGKTIHMWSPRMAHLKVNVTYVCDRVCPNCNRATQHCKSSAKENLDPEEFRRMLERCAELGKVWVRITLTGGEPVMHPQFDKIVDVMMEYKHKHNPKCLAGTYTYHHPRLHWKIEEALKKHPDLIVLDTGKEKPREHRVAMYMAPIDDPEYGSDHTYVGCHEGGALCGVGYDYRGFYCCSIAAGIARIFGIRNAIRMVKNVTRENLTNQYQALCSKCGFYTKCKAKGTYEPMSKVWKEVTGKS